MSPSESLFGEMFGSLTESSNIDLFPEDLTLSTPQFPITPPLLVSKQLGGCNEQNPFFEVPEDIGIIAIELSEEQGFASDHLVTRNSLGTGNGNTAGNELLEGSTQSVRSKENLSVFTDVPFNEDIPLVRTEQGKTSIKPSCLQRSQSNSISIVPVDSKETSPICSCKPEASVPTLNQKDMNRSANILEDVVARVRKERTVSKNRFSIFKRFESNNRGGVQKKKRKMMSIGALREEMSQLLKVTAEIKATSACTRRENENLKWLYDQRKEELDTLRSNK